MEQLMMWWEKQPLPEAELPAGFSLRTYRHGDARDWIDICSDGLGTGSMTDEDFNKQMLQVEGIRPEGIFFIVNNKDKAVGTATGVLKPEPAMGYLHMVSVHPEYRGHRLAKPVNAAVLKYLVECGCENVTLNTDDHRIPAIKVYLALGFRPIIFGDDMVDRWQKILEVLGIDEIDTYSADGKAGPVVKSAL